MSNTLDAYNPYWYCNEAIIALEAQLGLAGRIHRGYDKEPRSKGDTIVINKPGTFVVQDAPSVAQDLKPSHIEVKVDQYKDVVMSITDKELTYTGEKIIKDHIRPATYAIAKYMDAQLHGLSAMVPWFYDAASTTVVDDLTGVSQIMFENNVPMDDGLLHLGVGGTMRNGFQKLFASYNQAGNSSTEVLKTGNLGRWLGYEIFGTQQVGSHVKGTSSVSALTTSGALASGATTVTLTAGTVTGTLVYGDSFAITGVTQRFVVTNSTPVTAASNAFNGVTFWPPLPVAVTSGTAVTVSLSNHLENIAFHEHYAALAMAPLSDIGPSIAKNCEVATVIDEKTGIALRAMLWYEPGKKAMFVSLEALYGFKLLDGNLACKLRK